MEIHNNKKTIPNKYTLLTNTYRLNKTELNCTISYIICNIKVSLCTSSLVYNKHMNKKRATQGLRRNDDRFMPHTYSISNQIVPFNLFYDIEVTGKKVQVYTLYYFSIMLGSCCYYYK